MQNERPACCALVTTCKQTDMLAEAISCILVIVKKEQKIFFKSSVSLASALFCLHLHPLQYLCLLPLCCLCFVFSLSTFFLFSFLIFFLFAVSTSSLVFLPSSSLAPYLLPLCSLYFLFSFSAFFLFSSLSSSSLLSLLPL
jgi:hypothetical protein